MNVRTLIAVGVACTGLSGAAVAQVGYTPQRSPYVDLEYKQEATVFAGYYNAGTDIVGVARRRKRSASDEGPGST